jgi:hypothetical protein
MHEYFAVGVTIRAHMSSGAVCDLQWTNRAEAGAAGLAGGGGDPGRQARGRLAVSGSVAITEKAGAMGLPVPAISQVAT